MTTDFWELWNPLAKQVTFLQESKHNRYMLYGGARGGGKSKLLRWGCLWRVLEYAKRGHKNVRVGLFSEDYPTLKDRQIGKIKSEFPHWLGTVKSTQDEGLGFYLKDEYGGGAILLRNLDDPSKYQSAEFAGVAVEELTKNTIGTFDTLRGSLRWPGIPDTFFWGATNPGGVGHLWVKALWIEGDFSGEYEALQPQADQFCFVKSLPSDNPHLPQSYWDELNSLTNEALRRAWVEGDWDAFEGQAFGEFHRDVHVTDFKPEKAIGFRWAGGGDWGHTNQGVIYLIATGSERSVVRYEYLFKNTDPYQVGFNFGKVAMRFPRPEWIAIDTPPVMDGGPTILERMQKGLNDACGKTVAPTLINPPKGSGSRLTKKQMLHDWLAYKDPETGDLADLQDWQKPKLLFHESCKYIIRTLPALPLDENNSEDVDTDADDHGYDGICSWLMARVPYTERKGKDSFDENKHPGFKGKSRKMPWDEDVPDDGPLWKRDRAGVSGGDYGWD